MLYVGIVPFSIVFFSIYLIYSQFYFIFKGRKEERKKEKKRGVGCLEQ